MFDETMNELKKWDKITFEVKSVKFKRTRIHNHDNGIQHIQYIDYFYHIIDTNGNIYQTITSEEIHEGNVISATVLGFFEYLDEKRIDICINNIS